MPSFDALVALLSSGTPWGPPEDRKIAVRRIFTNLSISCPAVSAAGRDS